MALGFFGTRMQCIPAHAIADPCTCRRTRLICLLCGWRARGPLAQRFQPTRMALADRRWCARQNVEWLGLEISDRLLGSKAFPLDWLHRAGVGPGLACTMPIFAVVACGILRPRDGQRQLERVWRNDLAVLNSVSLVVARSELGRVEQGGRGWSLESVQWKMNCSARQVDHNGAPLSIPSASGLFRRTS